jgi:hypothetical protein
VEPERVTGVMAGSIFFYLGRKPFLFDHQLAPKRPVLLAAPIRKIYSFKFQSTPFFSAAAGSFRKLNLDCKSVPAFGTRLELE